MSQREEFDAWWEETKPFEVFKEEAWSIWQAATQNQADEIERLKIDIAEALRAVTNQDALIEATIKMCAQKCTNIATSNGNSDCTKIAADWCGRVILSLVPEDAQRELDALLMKVARAVADSDMTLYDDKDLLAVIEGVKNGQ